MMPTELSWRNLGGWEKFSPSLSNVDIQEPIKEFTLGVLKRDNFTCSCCGFQSRRSVQVQTAYMEISPTNQDYDDPTVSNWTAICPFCHASSQIINALRSGKYRLIAAPWISQNDLFNISRVLHVILGDPEHLYYSEAVAIYKRFESCEPAVVSLLPNIPNTEDSLSDNYVRYFGLLDSVLNIDQYAARHQFTQALRLLPVKGKFKEEAEYWDAAIYSQYPLSKWERLLQWKKEKESV